MEIDKNEKYWKDYTEFINEVKKLTGLSPSELLSRYEELIEALTDINENRYLEWQYELDYDLWMRQDIQIVLDHKPISGNILLQSFKEKIESLDKELKKHIRNPDQEDWWKKSRTKN